MAGIYFIAPYHKLAVMAKKVIYQMKENIEVIEGLLPIGMDLVKKAEDLGVEIIIAREGVVRAMRDAGVHIPVVQIPVTGYDIIRALDMARKISKKIGFIGYEEMISDARTLEDILKIKITSLPINRREDSIEKVYEAQKAKIKVIVGGVIARQVASRLGIKGILIESGEESIRQSILEARGLHAGIRFEKERAEKFRIIMDFAYDGIIAIDDKGKITVFNSVAERVVGIKSQEAIGRHIQEIIPNTGMLKVLEKKEVELGTIQKINDVYVTTNRVPIVVNNHVVGVVATFQDVTKIQKLEQKLRRELHAKGFVAKFSFENILGKSNLIKDAIEKAIRYSNAEASILILGETGTGKEIFAHSIHRSSKRREGPFVAVNCAALPESLLESELFGYAEGAFTGARKGGKQGLFEIAHEGTIFLDEIGAIHDNVQIRLLRVLQEREVMRIGDDRVIPVNVRVIAASNRDLSELVESGEFRADLYFRLNVLKLALPALRDIQEDIPLIAHNFLGEFSKQYGKKISTISPEAMQILISYDWPGNVRELKNVIERLVILSHDSSISEQEAENVLEIREKGEILTPAHIPQELKNLKHISRSLEKNLIEKLLADMNGKKTEVAKRLGINRTTLWRKIK